MADFMHCTLSPIILPTFPESILWVPAPTYPEEKVGVPSLRQGGLMVTPPTMS